jgi:hypothetical protein
MLRLKKKRAVEKRTKAQHSIIRKMTLSKKMTMNKKINDVAKRA